VIGPLPVVEPVVAAGLLPPPLEDLERGAGELLGLEVESGEQNGGAVRLHLAEQRLHLAPVGMQPRDRCEHSVDACAVRRVVESQHAELERDVQPALGRRLEHVLERRQQLRVRRDRVQLVREPSELLLGVEQVARVAITEQLGERTRICRRRRARRRGQRIRHQTPAVALQPVVEGCAHVGAVELRRDVALHHTAREQAVDEGQPPVVDDAALDPHLRDRSRGCGIVAADRGEVVDCVAHRIAE
jgi:hypothetical protein